MHLLQIPEFYHKKCEAHKDKDGRGPGEFQKQKPLIYRGFEKIPVYDSEIFSRIERHAVASHFVMKM